MTRVTIGVAILIITYNSSQLRVLIAILTESHDPPSRATVADEVLTLSIAAMRFPPGLLSLEPGSRPKSRS